MVKMSDLISREDAVSRISDLLMIELQGKRLPTWNEVYHAIDDIPSAESERKIKVERVSYGETLTYDFDGQCECGKWVDALWQYCPSCGARLEWE